MFNVSSAYKAELAKQFCSPCYAEMTIYNLDMEMQTGVKQMLTSAMPHTAPTYISRVGDSVQVKAATCELNYVRADGTYTLFDADNTSSKEYTIVDDNYITFDISSSIPTDGKYAISDVGMNIAIGTDDSPVGWVNGKKPITLLTDGSICGLNIRFECGFNKTLVSHDYIITGAMLIIPTVDIPNDIRAMTIHATSLYMPLHHGRILSLYFGSVDPCTSSDILLASYSDVNDSVGLQLPLKTLSVSLVNSTGVSQEREYDNPKYLKYHTQATFRILQEVNGHLEPIPTGRWFMESYAVSDDSINFSFVDAVGVLNDYTHYYSENTPKTVNDRVGEVLAIPNPPAGATDKTAAQKYSIRFKGWSGTNSTMTVINPCPAVSCAAALQLLANVAGVRICTSRTGENGDIMFSNNETSYITVRDISAFERYTRSVESEDVISTVKVTTTQQSTKTFTQDITTLKWLNLDPLLVTSNGLISGFTGTLSNGNAAALRGKIYAYSMYAWLRDSDDNVTINATIINQTNDQIVLSIGQKIGGDLTLSNPLVDGTTIKAADYAARIYAIKKYNVIYTITHRGLPELDAGDIITTEVDGASTGMLVTENKWDFKNGEMSGTTKGRRLK